MAYAAVGLGTQIYNNQIKSILLLMGFPILLLGMLGTFLAGIQLIQHWHESDTIVDWSSVWAATSDGLYRYGLWAMLATVVWFMVAYFFHVRMLRAAVGSHPVTRGECPRVYNLLENLCISRGIPVPQLEIIPSPALNAMAGGIDVQSHRIILTEGLINALDDDELETVIAHELSHILHRDTQLLMIAVIFVGIISFLAEMTFRVLMRSFGHRNNRKGGTIAIVLIAVIVAAIGYALAIVIRFALSRKREYLADAGAVDLTKKPEAMMRALAQVAGQSRIEGLAPEVAQMCLENEPQFFGLLATHPPIEKRIEVISKMTGTPVPGPSPWA